MRRPEGNANDLYRTVGTSSAIFFSGYSWVVSYSFFIRRSFHGFFCCTVCGYSSDWFYGILFGQCFQDFFFGYIVCQCSCGWFKGILFGGSFHGFFLVHCSGKLIGFIVSLFGGSIYFFLHCLSVLTKLFLRHSCRWIFLCSSTLFVEIDCWFVTCMHSCGRLVWADWLDSRGEMMGLKCC